LEVAGDDSGRMMGGNSRKGSGEPSPDVMEILTSGKS
jgi:hypothetical protein